MVRSPKRLKKKPKTAAAKYKGELAEPIVLDPYFAIASWISGEKGIRPDEKEEDAVRRRKDIWVSHARAQKLPLLLQHFRISLSDKHVWFKLALALAQEHVPGMRLAGKKRGRPAKSKKPTRMELCIAVDTVRFKRKRGISDAIRVLQQREPKTWGRFAFSNLRNRYTEATKQSRSDKSFLEQLNAMLIGIPHE